MDLIIILECLPMTLHPRLNSHINVQEMVEELHPLPQRLQAPLFALQKRHGMQSPRHRFGLIATISLFVCILALGASAYTKQHAKIETPTSPRSSFSVVVGLPILPEQIPPQSPSWRQNLPPGHHTQPQFPQRGFLQHPRTPPPQSSSLRSVANPPPPYSSENNHGRFRHHKRSQPSKQHDDNNNNNNNNNQQVPRRQQRHRTPSTLRSRRAPATPPSTLHTSNTDTTPSTTTTSENIRLFPPTSTATSTSEPSSPSYSYPYPYPYPYPYERRSNPISTPGIIGLTLGSLMLLGLLLYLGWVIVWRDFGMEILWEEVRMLSADC